MREWVSIHIDQKKEREKERNNGTRKRNRELNTKLNQIKPMNCKLTLNKRDNMSKLERRQ